MKVVMMTAAAVLMSTQAFAQDVRIISEHDIYSTVPITESVEVCTKEKDRTTEGAIIGGLIGSQNGNAGVGALLGGLLGNEVGGTKCHTETRKVGERKVYNHTNVVVELYGQRFMLSVQK